MHLRVGEVRQPLYGGTQHRSPTYIIGITFRSRRLCIFLVRFAFELFERLLAQDVDVVHRTVIDVVGDPDKDIGSRTDIQCIFARLVACVGRKGQRAGLWIAVHYLVVGAHRRVVVHFRLEECHGSQTHAGCNQRTQH